MIVFTNTKGGVGKSTLATHLAVYLVDQGNTVALLDVDEQRSSSQWALEAEPKITVRTAGTPEAVAIEMKDLQAKHDYVIADAPGRVDDETRTLMLLSDLAIFPMTPSILDLRSVTTATETLKYARTINNGLRGLLVLNRIKVRDTISRELKDAAGQLGLTVATTPVRDLQAFRDSAQQGTVVTRMGYRGREAAQDVSQLFSEILSASEHLEDNRTAIQKPGRVANE
jgi:chromosome partitioning protein